MAKFQNNPPYSVFATFYDQIAAPLRAPNQRAGEKILEPLVPRIQSACDLCCGTGTTAIELARLLGGKAARRVGGEHPSADGPLQPRIYAVDRSRQMLAVAREKFRRAGVNVRAIHADMRRFRLPQPVDLITCEFDAINHLARKRELQSVARAVARALRPGGWFVFDANTTKAFKELWIANWIVQGEGFFMAARGGYDRRRDKGWTELNWFIAVGAMRQSQNRRSRVSLGSTLAGATAATRGWQRFTERYEEVAWTKKEIRQALGAAGLRVRGAWDLTKFARGERWARPGCRTFWLAQKSRE
jgi:SAM-dependent methyltransferase